MDKQDSMLTAHNRALSFANNMQSFNSGASHTDMRRPFLALHLHAYSVIGLLDICPLLLLF